LNTTTKKSSCSFLQGGGEMGERTREFNWDLTPLGTPEQWPQSLRTTVAMILSSRFPMFLWWGDDMIQFYNDAYRPSLGNEGKHPRALGSKAIDTWPEIWDIIYPLIHQVKSTGIATWNEDQLVPIYRNGKLEDVYWTFGYSPILGDSDRIEGVLVVCTETTQKVQYVQKLEESDRRFRNLIHNAPVGIIVLSGEDMVVEIANDFYGQLINRTVDELLHKELFRVIPETEEHFRPILENVRTSGTPVYLYDYPYFIYVDGKKRDGYLNLVYQPYKDHNGNIIGIIALCHDVTEQVQIRKRIEESEHRYRTLIEATSVATALYIGRELRIQYVNDIMTGYWGKDPSVIGKLLKDAVPELVGQSFLDILDQVYVTGESYVGREEKAELIVDGELKPFYYNFTYKALRNKEGEIYGIHHMAMDVTPQVHAKQALEESERNFRNLVMQAPVAIAVFRGEDFVTEVANDSYLEIVGKTRTEFVGIPLFTSIPESRDLLEPLARELVRTGKAFPAREFEMQLIRNGELQTCYFNSIWEPLREMNGRVNGFTVVAHEVTDQVLARKKIEEIVAQRTEELAAANEALVKSNQELTRSNINLEEFAYAASHDLKEPVRKIHFFGDRLKNNLSDRMTEDEKRSFERMEAASKRMSSLIDDLLSFS
jgi:PAS domain S-box-containing protein